MALLGQAEFGCFYFQEAVTEPDDGLPHGGIHITIGYSSPDRQADFTSRMEQEHGPCRPISVPGTSRACMGVDADLPGTHFLILSTERTPAAAKVTASYHSLGSSYPAPPWADRSREITGSIARLIGNQLSGLR